MLLGLKDLPKSEKRIRSLSKADMGTNVVVVHHESDEQTFVDMIPNSGISVRMNAYIQRRNFECQR